MRDVTRRSATAGHGQTASGPQVKTRQRDRPEGDPRDAMIHSLRADHQSSTVRLCRQVPSSQDDAPSITLASRTATLTSRATCHSTGKVTNPLELNAIYYGMYPTHPLATPTLRLSPTTTMCKNREHLVSRTDSLYAVFFSVLLRFFSRRSALQGYDVDFYSVRVLIPFHHRKQQ